MATALPITVVAGGTRTVHLLYWITNGEEVCLNEVLSGTRGNNGLIWNQA